MNDEISLLKAENEALIAELENKDEVCMELQEENLFLQMKLESGSDRY
jgi:hypothetical protein